MAVLKPSWIDLPNERTSHLLGFTNSDSQYLDLIIKKYHGYSKQDISHLEQRTQELININVFLQDWINYRLKPYEKKKHLYWLSSIALSKSYYLDKLLKLYNIEKTITLEKYLTDWHAPKDQNNIILTLNKQRFFSLKKKNYWGDFWWTSLDPCHRHLSNYLLTYQDTIDPKLNFSIEFFIWLESQNVPYICPYEHYMCDTEKSECLILTKNVHLVDTNHNIVNCNTTNSNYLFIIDLNKKLYITKEKDYIFHSSICRGKPVISAGKIIIINGQISEISFESGHYITSIDAGYKVFETLFEQGYTQLHCVKVSFFYQRNKLTVELTPTDLQNLYTFKQSLAKNQQVSL